MKVSLNIVKSLTGLELPPTDELVERINSRLGGVEDVIELGPKYRDARIVRVVECEKHPNADKLSVCMIDVGSEELVKVVCGAPNARADMWAVWLPPKSTVPATFGTIEPFVLDARELRGVMSHGMLASAKELGLGDDHSGIVDIAERDLAHGIELRPGLSFAETFGLDDTIVDIENKMFTHRPDLFGQLGVAREINAILQDSASSEEAIDNSFENPQWYWSMPEFADADDLTLEVFNDAPELSPRFMSVAIKDVSVGKSPLWLQCQLVALGSKPVNNIVDWTNYVMLMTAQPTHAYDYDKLAGQKIGVRLAKQGETITLLNSKKYELTNEDIVIADGAGPVGLAGVMGGLDSEVTSETRNVVLEVANFDMYAVRRTSMRHGLFTDAVTRFNKGQSPLQADRVIKRLLDLLPGSQASPVYDLHSKSTGLDGASVHGAVRYSVDFVNKRLGTEFTANQIGNILRPANIATYPSGEDPDQLSSTAPFWRTDIELAEDVVEEVGRLYGFDRLPRSLPTRSMKPAPRNLVSQTKEVIRQALVGAGANEVLTYSFVHKNVIERAEQDADQAFRLSNALSPDLQHYRLTVLPSLLDRVHANIKSGHDEFVLFEIGKGHNKKYYASDEDGLPGETSFVDIVYASKKPKNGAAFYQVRTLIDQLAKGIGSRFAYRAAIEQSGHPSAAPFELERSALIETTDGVSIGVVGELKQSVVRSFKLPDYSAAATLDFDALTDVYRQQRPSYQPLSRYPSVSQDVSIKSAGSMPYSELLGRVEEIVEASAFRVEVEPVSIYQPDDSFETKTTTFRLKFTSYERTLSDKDVTPITQEIEQLGS